MYKLFFWNPWNFGQWIFQTQAETVKELLSIVKKRDSLTYKIQKEGEIIRFREAAGCYWRYGMVRPRCN